MKKKILAGILSLAMVFTLMPSTMVSAEETNTAQSETQAENKLASDSEAIEALQSRINALPTVDEFIALADGTTVEDSTLNQKQMDVYNEAQAIADELDQLSEEEQGQVDTSKLEALFEYFNSMTEETATTISPVTSGSKYINSGGTYTLKSGTYSTSASAIIINTTAAVTLNIEGNITATGSAFIYVKAACSNLTINGNGHTVKQTGSGNVLYNDNSSATVTLNNCVFTSGAGVTVANKGTTYVQSGSYSRTESSGQVFSNADGTLYIQGGTITNVEGTNDAVAAGNVYMTGGTVSAPNGGAIRLSQSGTKAEITGGTISGSKYGVYLKSGNPTCKIGNVTFSGNTNDVYLASGHTFTLSTDYAGANNIKVGVADSIGNNTKRQITTAGTAQSMLAKVSSVNSAYTVNYDTSGKYLYLWKHAHTWSYSANGNTITAKCSSDSDCGYYSTGLTATLTATDATYSGKSYDGASVENNISSVTGASASDIKYVGRDGTTYAESTTAPIDAGKYTASVTIGGKTATANFEINKAEVTKPSADETKFTYNGSSQTYNIAASDKYTVTGNTRTDAGTQTVTVALKNNYKWSDGSIDDLTFTFTIAKADLTLSLALKNWIYGRTPSSPELGNYKGDGTISYFYKKQGEADTEYKSITEADFNTIVVGKYTLKASVAEGTNYNAATAECDFAVTKQPVTITVSMDNGWTYGEEAKTPSVTVKAEDSDITSSYDKSQLTYTYYTDKDCTNKTTAENGAASEGAVPKNAGTYYVKAEVEATDNYSDGSAVAEFTIEKKEIGIEWSDDSLTYNGQTQTPTATATGLLKGDTCTITVTGGQKDTNAKTGSDKYTAIATAVDNANYKLPADGTTHEFTITPAELTVTWKDTELTYNGSEQAPTAELNGLMEGDTCKVTVTGGQTDANAKTNTESYQATASIDDKNYELKDATGIFKILPKSINGAEVKLTPGDVIHTGAEFTQAVDSVTLDGVALTVSDDYEIADSSTFKAADFGVYTITVNGVGNYKDTASVEWKIKDENPPTGEITIAENKWNSFLNNVTFGHFFKKTQTVTINASDEGSGVDKVYYYNSNVILSLDAVKALADIEWKSIKNGGSYNIDPENQYVVYAKITDKSGNVTYISSEGFVIDKTAPTITGVKDQGAYCEAVTFTAADAYLKTVTVDGKEVTLSADGSYQIAADNGTHTIIAEDKAGNTTTVQVTVYDGHSWKAPVFTWSADYSSATATITCAHDDSHTETKDCTVKKETTKQASGTEKGEITYTATVTFDGKTYEDTKTQETVIAGSEEIGSNGGKITTEIIVADDMPKTEIKNLTVETAKSLLTAEELAQVEAGAEITIYLEANSLTEDAVSASDKTYVEGKLDGIMEQLMQSEGLTSKKQVTTGIQYIDLSLYKRIGNGAATKLKSTGQNELEITVEIPANLKSDNSKRTYYIIRVHETGAGTEVDILPATKSGDELTFKTDRFSTYAIAYAEPNGYIMPAKVTLNPTQATLTSKGATTQLTATVEPSNATNKNVTWASSDTSVATVDANGLVTAVANGTATITVTTEEGGLTATATITVNISSGGGDTPTPNPSEEKKPTSISLNKTKDTLTSKGSTSQLIATVKPDDAANKNVTWKSSDTSVATVDANGLVTAVANGTATITATTVEGGLTATATITVKISSGDNGNSDNNNNNNDNNNNSSSDNNNGNNSNDNSSATVPDSQKESQNVTSPKTGDDSNMALWTTLLIASVAGLAALFGRRKKRS